MNPKEVGRRISMDGGRIGENIEFNVAKAIRLPGRGDRDGDGVPDMYDCQPLNPEKDGFWGDVGRAAKERVSAEVEDIRERTVSRIKGEDVYGGTAIKKRAILRGVEQEEELKEAIQQAKKRGKRKAQKRYGVAPTPLKAKKKLEPTQESIEYHDVEYAPVKKTPTKKRKKKVLAKKLPARTKYYVGL